LHDKLDTCMLYTNVNLSNSSDNSLAFPQSIYL
jgi:hypothetical protein